MIESQSSDYLKTLLERSQDLKLVVVEGLVEATQIAEDSRFDAAVIDQALHENARPEVLAKLKKALEAPLIPVESPIQDSPDTIDLSEHLSTQRSSSAVSAALELSWDPAVVAVDGQVVFANEVARSLLGGTIAQGRAIPAGFEARDQVRLNGRVMRMRSCGIEWDGAPARLFTFRDSTDPSRKLRDQLEHSERLAAMGQMAAGVAHEVNNPAAFVTANLTAQTEYVESLQRCFAELREQAEEVGEPQRARFEAIVDRHDAENLLSEIATIGSENLEGMSRVCSIVRDLKNFSRIEKDVVELVHLNEVVNAACALVHNQVRFKANLIKDLGSPAKIAADPGKLTQVVMNLLLNAAQAMPDDGGLDQNFIQIQTFTREGQAVISVSDSGCGIPEEIQAKIFDPFFTTKERNRGTGLGLSLCADIIRQHGGDIRVSSTVGRGSRFEVVFPQDTGLMPAAPTLKAVETQGVFEPLRVLLIDDEVMLLKAYQRMLSSKHEVFSATGGAEAIEHLRYQQDYDVVICDLMMPQVDGIMVYEAIQELAPHLRDRILFCSGGAFTTRMKSFVADVGAPILEKPAGNKELLAAIQGIVQAARPLPSASPSRGGPLQQPAVVGPTTRRF